jgi:glucose/arabinose dehydrogenase
MFGRRGRALIAGAGFVAAVAGASAVLGGSDRAEAQADGLRLASIGNFDSPVYIHDAPGAAGLLFVVEQPGTIRVIRDGETLPQPFLDLRDRVKYGGEQGLLSIAFDPKYAKNRRLFVYYTNRNGDIEVDGFKRKRETPTEADPGSRSRVIRIAHPQFANHNGGQLQFGPDRMLYLGTGDGGDAGDPHGNAQNRNVLLGKLLRIDPKKGHGYRTPNSNPFAGKRGRDEIYARGLRNPFRFSFDRRSGDIFIGDVGQDSWEEIDHTSRKRLRGANFGWDVLEGNHDFEGRKPPSHYRKPALEYSSKGSACAVTGGVVVRGTELPALAGRYVYADFCDGDVRSFAPGRPGPTDSAAGLHLLEPTSFVQTADGRLYVTSLGGEVSLITQG